MSKIKFTKNNIFRLCTVETEKLSLNQNKQIDLLKCEENKKLDEFLESEEARIINNLLIELTINANLRNAILNSSDTLLENIDKYLLCPNPIKNKKYRQTLTSSYFFAMRAAYKTIPLSSFTEIGICLLDESNANKRININIYNGNTLKYKFSKKVNSFLFDSLGNNHFERNNNFRSSTIILNRSCFENNKELIFYFSDLNIDGFKILTKNEFTQELLQLLKKNHKGIKFSNVVHHFYNNFKLNNSDVEIYLEKLSLASESRIFKKS